MATYVIYQAEILDAERYESCRAKASPAMTPGGGRYLVRGSAVEALEGETPAGRTAVAEFKSKQAALDCYRGDYAEICKLREGAARAKLYIVEGV